MHEDKERTMKEVKTIKENYPKYSFGEEARTNVIDALRREARTNPAFRSVAIKLALRQRARSIMTMASLKLNMEREGFTFKDEEYSGALNFLASLGFGVLLRDNKGEIKALDKISIKLQDIGKAAIEDHKELESFKTKPKYQALDSSQAKPVKKQKELKDLVEPKAVETAEDITSRVSESKFPLTLSIRVHGTPITFSGPYDVSPEEVGRIIMGFDEMMKKMKGEV